MPITVPNNLPAIEILRKEKIFVIDEERAVSQDIRPLKIAILNLMPLKEITEVQLLRLIGNTPLQIEVTLLHPRRPGHTPRNTAKEHLQSFYNTFDNIYDQRFDGLIITGAPIEQYEYEEITYWDEIKNYFDWSKTNVTSTFHICWAAQAGLYYHYGVPKYNLEKKMFGVFPHYTVKENVKLLRGFDDIFYAPHSVNSKVNKEDIEKVKEIEVLAESDDSGVYIVASKERKIRSEIYVTGHSEYDRDTLKTEYLRDLKKGIDIDLPKNYFHNDNPENEPQVLWRGHSNLLFSNWLNYYVYQETPFDLGKL